MEALGRAIVGIVVWFVTSLIAAWLAWWILNDVTPMPDWSFGEWWQVILVVFSVLGMYDVYKTITDE